MKKISTYKLCGFHHVHVYDIKSDIKINDKFFKYPKSGYYLHGLYPGGELLKWEKIDFYDGWILGVIDDTINDCDVYQFEENMDYINDDIYFAGVSNSNSMLILNIDKKKLYHYRYYDIDMFFN